MNDQKHRGFIKNSIWNVCGQVVPLFAAVVSVPLLIKGFGTDRFGLLTLSWMLTGYFNLFDLGLGRALTQLVSGRVAKNEHHEIASNIKAVLTLMFALGFCAGLIMIAFGSFAIDHLLKVPATLREEAIVSTWIMAVTIPFVISTSALKGVFEAINRFDLLNLIRLPLGTASYILPLLILPFSKTLPPVMVAFLVIRVLGYFLHLYFCRSMFPDLSGAPLLRREVLGPLLKLGSWMTVSNVIGPLMVQMDRFYIGSVIGLTAVSYYATPYEMTTKLWVLSSSLLSVLFPALTKALITDHELASRIYRKCCLYLGLLLAPVTFAFVLFAPDILRIWISADFSANSFRVMQILALGVLINAIAGVPFALVQAAGRPDVTAKLHISELALYIGLLWFLTKTFGINGAAWAWTVRMTVDVVALGFCADIFVFRNFRAVDILKGLLISLTLGAVFAGAYMASTRVEGGERFVLFVLLLGVYGWFSSYMIERDDRYQMLSDARRLTRRILGEAGVL